MEDLIRRTIGPQIELDVAATENLWMIQIDQNQFENSLLKQSGGHVRINHGHPNVGMQIMTKPFAMEALGKKIREMIHS